MALISETSDDGSNGGEPNKKPEELHKNPQEEEENQNEKPQEEEQVENLAHVTRHIPEDIAERILLLDWRCHYPKLSLFSRAFRRVISSRRLYQRRLELGLTEPVLYASIQFPPVRRKPSWYILNRNAPRMIEVSSLPPLMPRSAVVTIGYEMYVIGGWGESVQTTSNVLVVID
ncbi:PREDICTED: putative F-box/kelch-repeat protein At2g29780 [Camelina sativa]|uniref:F-box/kelch-repeat protein At2g29780 n=1 Tax=Camelina sativa TaxID=90675 RepID=A0ABM0ZBF5_CAMSA|nr:PREDICTED: putative F-box/kelch-repeat protein At2g29780 [Camelina sativa]